MQNTWIITILLCLKVHSSSTNSLDECSRYLVDQYTKHKRILLSHCFHSRVRLEINIVASLWKQDNFIQGGEITAEIPVVSKWHNHISLMSKEGFFFSSWINLLTFKEQTYSLDLLLKNSLKSLCIAISKIRYSFW